MTYSVSQNIMDALPKTRVCRRTGGFVRGSYRFRTSISAILATVLVAGNAAHAQNLDDFHDVIVEEKAAVREADVAFEVSPRQFDQWVFGGGQSAAQGRRHLDSLLALHVESIDRVCSLTDPQRAKLELAGRGDIKRFFDEVEDVRQEFMEVRRDQQKFNPIWQKISPLQLKLNSGMFQHDSLVYKVLQRTLESEQFARYEDHSLERLRFHHRANVAMVVAMLENGIPLRDEQRQSFIKLMLDETDPPRAYGQYGYYVVLYQASELPEEEVKPIFDEGQWRALRACFRRAKAMEPTLKKIKLIP